MKAIRVAQFGPPDVMRLEELSDPRPVPGQVLIRIEAAGVNPVDVYIRSGQYGRLPGLPYTPGLDGAGLVEAIGDGVTGWRPGDRVYVGGAAGGTYATHTLCAASQIHPLPKQVGFAQGAAVNVPYATAYRALFQKARALPGESVLVHGASGGVGLAAVQLARAAGLFVYATAGTAKGRDLASAQGAHEVLDHRTSPDHLARLSSLTGGRGVDVILEMLANVNLGIDLKALAPGGRVVVIGSRGRVEIDPRDGMGRDATILTMSLWNTPEAETRTLHAALQAGLESGALRPVVARELPLAEAGRAHQAIMEPGASGKIVLLP
ncbi:MAG TPA: NADPH:quinone reductase [Candidatus Polarisedimenticolia bacterium]